MLHWKSWRCTARCRHELSENPNLCRSSFAAAQFPGNLWCEMATSVGTDRVKVVFKESIDLLTVDMFATVLEFFGSLYRTPTPRAMVVMPSDSRTAQKLKLQLQALHKEGARGARGARRGAAVFLYVKPGFGRGTPGAARAALETCRSDPPGSGADKIV